MRGLSRRLSALEAAKPDVLPPFVKAWLGWPLTDAERARLDDPVLDDCSTANLPEEVRTWLAID